MRYLLCGINAKYIHSNLAIYSLQAYAKRNQGTEKGIHEDSDEHTLEKESQKNEIIIREYTINHYVENILEDLYEAGADVIIFSCYIWNISFVKELAVELKKVKPGCSIWVGGPEVSYCAKIFLEENPAVDLVMLGEGEKVFSELVSRYDGQIEQLRGVQGITIRIDEQIEEYGWAPLMEMDDLPFVYENFHLFAHKILYYETSRGCPFRCSYCLSSVDKRVRFRTLSIVKEELDLFLEAKVPQVKFVDRTFNCDRKRAYEIWEYLTEHDNGVTNFHFEISSDLLEEESIELFRKMRPGLIQLEIGVQSTNPKTIDAIHRHMNLPKLFQRVDQVHALGNIHQHLDLIAGLPYEDYRKFGKSFNDLYVHEPDQLQLGFLKVLKGTRMMSESEEYEIAYRSKEPYEVLSTKWLSYEDVIALKGIEELTELYYNSGQYTYTLRYVVPQFETPFAFFEAFSKEYRENGYHKLSHNRLEKYEILRNFLKKQEKELPLLDEIMVYDLYLRENVKGRPKWACDLAPYKKTWKEIYRTQREVIYSHISEEEYDSKKAANQSHIEYFSFDIHAFVKEGKIEKGNFACLFDYKEKHPWNQEARTVSFSLENLLESEHDFS